MGGNCPPLAEFECPRRGVALRPAKSFSERLTNASLKQKSHFLFQRAFECDIYGVVKYVTPCSRAGHEITRPASTEYFSSTTRAWNQPRRARRTRRCKQTTYEPDRKLGVFYFARYGRQTGRSVRNRPRQATVRSVYIATICRPVDPTIIQHRSAAFEATGRVAV